jgi:hypothetical protein
MAALDDHAKGDRFTTTCGVVTLGIKRRSWSVVVQGPPQETVQAFAEAVDFGVSCGSAGSTLRSLRSISTRAARRRARKPQNCGQGRVDGSQPQDLGFAPLAYSGSVSGLWRTLFDFPLHFYKRIVYSSCCRSQRGNDWAKNELTFHRGHWIF